MTVMARGRTLAGRAYRATEAVELRRLGLPVAEVADLLRLSDRTVYRLTAGHDCTPTGAPPERLTSARARKVWRTMVATKARHRYDGEERLAARVSRLLARLPDGPGDRVAGPHEGTGRDTAARTAEAQ